MPFILFNSRQRRRVLIISSQQSRRTTYISSGILLPILTSSPLSSLLSDYPQTLSFLYKTPIGYKLTTPDTQTVTESSKHSDRINISFYGHKRDPYQIKGALQCYNHSTTHASAHTSQSKTQAEGRGT